jgi:hypothetical protein
MEARNYRRETILNKGIRDMVIGGILIIIGLILYDTATYSETQINYMTIGDYQIPIGAVEVHPYAFLILPAIIAIIAGIIAIIIGILKFQKK